MQTTDERYLAALLDPLKVCGNYHPKFGQPGEDGLTLDAFQSLYASDPFYSWIGLDNPLMYAAHKAAGGMTSVYRQIGTGCQSLFRLILQDSLSLSPSDVQWSYDIPKADGKGTRTLSLDGRIPLSKIGDKQKRRRVESWMERAAHSLDVDAKITEDLRGIVFEVRQGYKSKDSKRTNADIANAASAYTKAYLPCLVVFSRQMSGDLLMRYRGVRWAVLVGSTGEKNDLASTYDFVRGVVGYDLETFFERNRKRLREDLDMVLRSLLTPEGK